MSKYKVGDRFIIEIKQVRDNGDYVIVNKNIKDTMAIYSLPEYALDLLPLQTENAKTYEDGLADAWEAARKVVCDIGCGGFNKEQLADIFEISDPPTIMTDYTAQQAVDMIYAYEDSKEIKRGDEVIIYDQQIGVVTYIDSSVIVMKKNGDKAVYSREHITKTGRNFASQLDALLAEIGGDLNGKD